MGIERFYKQAKLNGGSDKLREICCKEPEYAYMYAKNVDKVPREDTRSAAIIFPYLAYWYALNVDRGYTMETRRACYESTMYYLLYLKDVVLCKYYEEIHLLSRIKRINSDSRRIL